jgi:hypothetical protein
VSAYIHPDFFPFCEAMLEKYRDSEQVMCATGNNFQFGLKRGGASYYFSCFLLCWGWASWARAWGKYNFAMDRLHFVNTRALPKLFHHDSVVSYYGNVFSATKAGRIDTWDYQWQHTLWEHGGLCVTPNVNLVGNVGFGGNATHTKSEKSVSANVEVTSLGEITHPYAVERNAEADEWVGLFFVDSSVPAMLKEAARRLENGEPCGVLGITRALRSTYGDSPLLFQLEALTFMWDGRYVEALSCAVKFFEAEPESPEARNLVGMIKAALSGKKMPLTR